jgi:hypothetical protein
MLSPFDRFIYIISVYAGIAYLITTIPDPPFPLRPDDWCDPPPPPEPVFAPALLPTGPFPAPEPETSAAGFIELPPGIPFPVPPAPAPPPPIPPLPAAPVYPEPPPPAAQ